MCTLLAKLAIGFSATMATGFYYLAAAPPASAGIDVCGPGNFSDQCVKGQQSTSLRDAKPEAQVAEPQVAEPQVAEPPLATPDPVPDVPVSPESALPAPDPVPDVPVSPESALPAPDPIAPLPEILPPAVIPDPSPPSPAPITSPPPTFPDIYKNPPSARRTAIPEPGTVVALLLTGAGIICAGRKRNKQVPQQR